MRLLFPLQSMAQPWHKSFAWGGGELTILGKFFGRCFTWGLMIRSCKHGKQMVKRFQRSSQVSFSSHWPDLGYWYIIWKVNTTNKRLNLKNTFCTFCLWGWDFHVRSVFFFKIIIVVTYSLKSYYRALLDLSIYRLDSLRTELRCYIQNRKGLGSNPGSRWPWGQVSIKHSDYDGISGFAPRKWSKVTCGAVNSLVIRFAWGI